MAKKKITFENTVIELEEILLKLDNPDITLSDSLNLYKKGIELSIVATQYLNSAEEEIKVLSMSSKNNFNLTNFTNTNDKD